MLIFLSKINENKLSSIDIFFLYDQLVLIVFCVQINH